eukprot:m51a1_g10643 putative dna ligase (566) ;mRNA; f:21976-24048
MAVMLAEKWDDQQDPKGWWMSEKLDGMRAWWNGSAFSSRNGITWSAPAWFKKGLPAVPLDGELWCGRSQFRECVSIVKNSKRQDDWKYLTYLVFDAPKFKGDFEERYAFLRTVVSEERTPYARLVGQVTCEGREHLMRTLKEVEQLGGEGLMLRKPHSQYEYCRTTSLLKVKTFFDEEAVVVGHENGTGRNQFRMGHLICKTPDGREFKVGGGFNDHERNRPPKIGAVITYKYFELSQSGKPRFPIFVSVREDINWDDYCRCYKPPQKVVPKDLKTKHSIMFSNIDELRAAVGEAPAAPAAAAPAAAPAAAATPAGQKTPCKYGKNCYRQNPEHLAQYSHGPVDPVPYVTLDLDQSAPPPLPDDVPKSPLALLEDSIDENGRVWSSDDEAKPSEEKKRPLSEPPVPEPKRAKVDEPAATGGEQADTRPMCRYASACYQKNPEHHRRFRHPPDVETTQDIAALPKYPRVAVVTEDGRTHEIPPGLTTVGRNFGGLTSQMISKRQLDFEVQPTGVTVVCRGLNSSVLLHAEERKVLENGREFKVEDGDLVWLLPDLSLPIRIEITKQ